MPELVAQLARASDQNSEDPGSNPGWISMSFFANPNLAMSTRGEPFLESDPQQCSLKSVTKTIAIGLQFE